MELSPADAAGLLSAMADKERAAPGSMFDFACDLVLVRDGPR